MSRFLADAEVLVMHDQVIERWGGSHGVRDVSLLESALAAPQQTFGGEFLHPDTLSQAAALLRSLALNHPFIDGNKRTAFLSAVVFLELNGWVLRVPDKEAVRFMARLPSDKPTLKDIKTWLARHSERRDA